MPKIIDYDDKKREIAESAMQVFSEKGYYNTNFANIASKCNMGRTTIYQYFKNKDEIFFYSIEQVIHTLEKDLHEIINNPSLSAIDKIKLIIGKIVTQYENHSKIILLIELWLISKYAKNAFSEKLSEHALKLKNIFLHLLGEASTSNEIKPVNVEYMAQTLYSLVQSFILHLTINKNSSIDSEEHLKSIHLLIDGLRT